MGGALVPSFGSNPPMFVGEGVDCFDIVLTVHGIGDFDAEIKNALEVHVGGFVLKFLPLGRIIASKTFLNREKDRVVLPALRSAAKALLAQPEHRRK